MTITTDNFIEKIIDLPCNQPEQLLRDLANWGKVTCIIIHGGCVFEFKGDFPKGFVAEGFYNLDSQQSGFEGHIRLSAITGIQLQAKRHRGRPAYAIVFNNNDQTLFKVFLGRDNNGDIFPEQLTTFNALKNTYKKQTH